MSYTNYYVAAGSGHVAANPNQPYQTQAAPYYQTQGNPYQPPQGGEYGTQRPNYAYAPQANIRTSNDDYAFPSSPVPPSSFAGYQPQPNPSAPPTGYNPAAQQGYGGLNVISVGGYGNVAQQGPANPPRQYYVAQGSPQLNSSYGAQPPGNQPYAPPNQTYIPTQQQPPNQQYGAPQPNQAYVPTQQQPPNQAYVPTQQQPPNQQYTTTAQQPPNQSYVPSQQQPPNQAYVPTQQQPPNQGYSATQQPPPNQGYPPQNQPYPQANNIYGQPPQQTPSAAPNPYQMPSQPQNGAPQNPQISPPAQNPYAPPNAPPNGYGTAVAQAGYQPQPSLLPNSLSSTTAAPPSSNLPPDPNVASAYPPAATSGYGSQSSPYAAGPSQVTSVPYNPGGTANPKAAAVVSVPVNQELLRSNSIRMPSAATTDNNPTSMYSNPTTSQLTPAVSRRDTDAPVSSYRAKLTADEIKKRKEEALCFKGRNTLIVDTDIQIPNTKDLAQEKAYFEGMKSGATMFYHTHYQRKSEVKMRLNEEAALLTFGDHGFVFLQHIIEIRKGRKTEVFKKSPSDESISFSLFYGPITLDFEAATPATCDFWIQGIILAANSAKTPFNLSRSLKEIWTSKQTFGSEISWNELVQIMREYYPKFDAEESDFRKKFDEVDERKVGSLPWDKFLYLMRTMHGYDELRLLFEKYATGGVMGVDAFLEFLKKEQKETKATLADAKAIIVELLEGNEPPAKQKRLSMVRTNTMGRTNTRPVQSEAIKWDLFCEYLSNEQYNNAFNDEEYGYVYQDMEKPLTWYYVESSHNTYCTGDQLTMDCWDGDDGTPDILHGRTLTSKIKFADVVQCIRENGFVTSKYPLILSLENHCTYKQQLLMAEHFSGVFGHMLLRPAATDVNTFPTAAELEYKIILKGPVSANYYDNDFYAQVSAKQAKMKPDKMAQQLCEITYLRATHLSEVYQASRKPQEMSSFSEEKIDKFYSKWAPELVQYSLTQFARIYPKGTRVDSSNYDPTPSWNLGCQMTALNYQSSADHLWINHAKFDDNGGCGLVLKPPLMNECNRFDPVNNPKFYQRRNINSPIKKMIIKVLGGRMLPISKTNKSGKSKSKRPYVSLKVHGLDCDLKTYKGNPSMQSNIIAPDWSDTFTFDMLMSEMAVLLITIDVSSKQGVGYACFPVKCLREGYRVAKIYDTKGNKMDDSELLLKITFHLDNSTPAATT